MHVQTAPVRRVVRIQRQAIHVIIVRHVSQGTARVVVQIQVRRRHVQQLEFVHVVLKPIQ